MRQDNPVARLLEPPARRVAILGGWWLTGLAFLTCAGIFCRKFLNVSLQGVDEIGAYTLAVFSTLSFAHALVDALGTRLWASMEDHVFLSIPLCILLGEMLVRSGSADRLDRGLADWLNILPGGRAAGG